MDEIGMPLRIGMGIDVGPLVVGHIGHADTAMLTVIGTTVNAASRLEALTKEKNCQLIVASEVLDPRRTRLARVSARGGDDPRPVDAALGGADRSRAQPARDRRASRLREPSPWRRRSPDTG